MLEWSKLKHLADDILNPAERMVISPLLAKPKGTLGLLSVRLSVSPAICQSALSVFWMLADIELIFGM